LPPPSIATNAVPMNPGAGGGSTVGGVPGAGAGPIPGSGPIPGINPPTLNPGTGFPTNSVPGTGAFPFPFPGTGTFPPGPTTNAPPVMTQEEINREYNRRLREAMEIFKREAKLIRRQAREGNARQQHNLAVLYTLGLGVPLDFKRAHHWFNRAAQQGLSESQFNLGIAYQGGMGVQKDFVTSYKYYTLAAAKGLPFAGQWRDHLAQYMNRIQIEAGQRMARGFLQGIERWEINKANEEHDRLRQNRILGIESRP